MARGSARRKKGPKGPPWWVKRMWKKQKERDAAEKRHSRFQELRALDRSPDYNLTEEELKEYKILHREFCSH